MVEMAEESQAVELVVWVLVVEPLQALEFLETNLVPENIKMKLE